MQGPWWERCWHLRGQQPCAGSRAFLLFVFGHMPGYSFAVLSRTSPFVPPKFSCKEKGAPQTKRSLSSHCASSHLQWRWPSHISGPFRVGNGSVGLYHLLNCRSIANSQGVCVCMCVCVCMICVFFWNLCWVNHLFMTCSYHRSLWDNLWIDGFPFCHYSPFPFLKATTGFTQIFDFAHVLIKLVLFSVLLNFINSMRL